MENVLVVSSSDKGSSLLTELLKAGNITQITNVGNGSEARRLLIEKDFDLVMINAPLMDEFGHDLALMITENTSAGVIILVKCELADDISAKVEDFGVFVVAKPIGKALFYQALKLVAASRRRILGLKKENVKLQKKIEEIRLVDRAKCVLIQYLNMSEEQAHRYIEKQAMDLRLTKREIATNVLKTYED